MGNICTNSSEKEECTDTIDTYKNSVQYQVQLGENCSLAIILGHYKSHRSDALVLFTEQKHIDHCDGIRDYTTDPDKTIEIISNMRKTFYKATVTKSCPYKKLLICVLPRYLSEDSEAYQDQLKNLVHEVFDNTRDCSLELVNTIEGVSNLPNQMILGILMRELAALRTPFKINLITAEKKMLNLYKYELIKCENFTVKNYHE